MYLRGSICTSDSTRKVYILNLDTHLGILRDAFFILFVIFALVRFAVLAQTARIPVPVFSQVFRPSSNGRHILPLPSLKAAMLMT